MSDFVRLAILGTGQTPASEADLSGSPVDALVALVAGLGREQALLARAGGYGFLRRAAAVPEPRALRGEPAPAETLGACSARLGTLLVTLLDESDDALLAEALERLAGARLRLPEELLPRALSKTSRALRAQLHVVLGERGRWLARQRAAWAWGATAVAARDELPADFEARWEEGSAAERREWLRTLRRLDRSRARELITASWKQEKAEQRLGWLEVIAADTRADDEPLLEGMLGDRSSGVRMAAARTLWRLPESALGRRLHERADALVSFELPAPSLLGKLRALVSSDARGTWRVTLPPEAFDPRWERDGIAETAPQGVGRRQWWLMNVLSAVPPAHWTARFSAEPERLIAALGGHEFEAVVLDGLVAAALRHDARDWFAPLWDAVSQRAEASVLTPNQLAELSARLNPEQAESRMLASMAAGQHARLAAFPHPWPASVAAHVIGALSRYEPAWTELLPIAAYALPVASLPGTVPVPEMPAPDYAVNAYLRALDRFQFVANVRRTIAEEIRT